MSTATDLLRLAAWLSPAFPTGAFAWSGGLEAAHGAEWVDGDTLLRWIEDLLAHGTIRADAVLLSLAMRGEDVADLALALIAAPERREEVLAQGEAFSLAVGAWDETWPVDPLPLPVAVARAARASGFEHTDTVLVFTQSQAVNVVQAAQRLGTIGQNEGVRILAHLEPLIEDTARFATNASEDDLGSFTPRAEIAALRHSTLSARIFRS